MKIHLTDGSNRSFDAARAQQWEEDRMYQSGESVSVATGSATEHEELFRAYGRWILRRWSDTSDRETVEVVSDERAEAWLLLNGHGSKDSARYCVAA